MVQYSARLSTAPLTICNEAVALTKDACIAAGGVWSIFNRAVWAGSARPASRAWGVTGIMEIASGARRAWVDPIERAYSAASTDYVQDARRVIDALRSAGDDADPVHDPLAGSWDDAVRRPSLLLPAPPVSPRSTSRA